MQKQVLVLLLLCSMLSISQNCDYMFSGTVSDLHDGTPLIGATVRIENLNTAYLTGLNGAFIFTDLCGGNYSITVTHDACDAKTFQIKISGNTEKNLKLEHHLEELNEVTLTGNAYSKSTETALEHQITLNTLSDAADKSLGDLLKSISGVSSLNTGNTIVKPVINGLHSSRVAIISNGIKLEDQEWGAEHAPNLDINAVGKLTVIKGAAALQYSGDAIGGLIIAETQKTPVKDTLYGNVQTALSTNGKGGVLTSNITKATIKGWYAKVQGTLKKFGDFEAPDYVLTNTGIEEQSAAIQLGFNRIDFGFEGQYNIVANTIGILKASHLGGAEDQLRAINSNQPLVIEPFSYAINPPRQEVSHQTLSFKGYKKLNHRGELSLRYAFQNNHRLEFDIRRGNRSEKAAMDLELKTHSLNLDFKYQINNNFNIKSGLLARFQDNYANPETGVKRLIPDFEKYNFGVYTIADYKLNSKWLFEAGARFDYNYLNAFKYYKASFWEERGYDIKYPDLVIDRYNDQILVNPKLHFQNPAISIGLKHKLTDQLNLFLNYGMASRAPNPSELFSEGLHHSASRIEIGDLSFHSERAHKVNVTLQQNTAFFSFNISPFSNWINNYILLEPTAIRQTIRGNFQVWEYRQTNAHLYGVDIDAGIKLSSRFNTSHKLALVKGYELESNLPLIHMPPVNTTNEIVYRNEKINNLTLKLQSHYEFQQNEYPNTNFEVYIPTTQTYETIDVSTPPEAYHLLHFTGSIDFKAFKNNTLRLGLNIQNVLDTSYRNYLNRMRFYADDLGRNININFKLNF